MCGIQKRYIISINHMLKWHAMGVFSVTIVTILPLTWMVKGHALSKESVYLDLLSITVPG